MTDRDDALIRVMRDHWQASIDRLSGHDLSRLNRSRQQALTTIVRPALIRHLLPRRILMAMASAMLLLMIGLHLSQPEIMPPAQDLSAGLALQDNSSPSVLDDDLELLADVDSLDLITDLDFYQWLEVELDEAQTL